MSIFSPIFSLSSKSSKNSILEYKIDDQIETLEYDDRKMLSDKEKNDINQGIKKIDDIKILDYKKELENTKKYWEKYVKEHDTIKSTKEKRKLLKNPRRVLQ